MDVKDRIVVVTGAAGGVGSVAVALLAKLGQHEAALSIYVHTLRDMGTAETYCARRFESGRADDVYLALLRVCVPTCTTRLYLRAASTSLRPSQMLWLKGFST